MRVMRHMPRPFLTRRLVVILTVWLCICGMAAVDLLDLTDDYVPPLVNLAQGIEAELDELDWAMSLTAVAFLAWSSIDQPPGNLAGFIESAASSSFAIASRPLYQQQAQYRI
jgi:hypothetical protein